MDPDQTHSRKTSDDETLLLGTREGTQPGHFSRSFLGQTLGEYQVEREIGRGSMGIVYEARHARLKRVVALKVLPPSLSVTETVIKRFLREAESVARLDHASIVRIYEIGDQDGVYFYAMQYIEGSPLDASLRERKLSPRECAMIAAEVARALGYAHDAGIIHRDIKPANIILSHKDRPVVTDFGLARPEKASSLTESGALVGTPIYMSPEQVRGERADIDRRTDIYSLGVTLYEMLAGATPFLGRSTQEILRKIELEDPRPVRRLRADVPKALETICHKAIEKEPRRRYQTAADLAQDLERFLGGVPVRARPISPGSRVIRKMRRHPAIAWLIVLLACSSAITAVVIIGNDRAHQREQELLARQRTNRFRQLMAEGADLLLRNRATNAIPKYDEAIALDPGRSAPYIERGKCRYALQSFEAALADFERAYEVDPGDLRARLWRGIVRCNYATAAERDLGIQDIKDTLDADPDDPECLLEASRLYVNLAKNATEFVARDQLLNAGFSRIRRAFELLNARNQEQYQAHLRETGERDESLLERGLDQAFVTQGLLYEEQNMPDLAADNYERATKINPSNAQAWTLWRSDRTALTAPQNANPAPDTEGIKSSSWFAVLIREGAEGMALSLPANWDADFSRKAADALSLFPPGGRVPDPLSQPLSPEQVEDALARANQQWQDGDREAAVALYRQIIATDTRVAEPFHHLTEYYLDETQDLASAREMVDQARQYAPSHPVTLYLALRVYSVQRDQAKVMEILKTVEEYYPALLALPGLDFDWLDRSGGHGDDGAVPQSPPSPASGGGDADVRMSSWHWR